MKIPWYLMAKGKGDGIYKTASGPIVSVSDALAAPIRSLIANIEPVQDLHGYNNPWPAGGGKNKAYTSLVGGSVGGTGNIGTSTSYDMALSKVEQGVTYAITTNDSQLVCAFYETEPYIGISASYDSSRVVQASKIITSPITGYIAFRVLAGYTTYQCEVGNQATSYAPYSNICPISGWSAVKVWRTGSNVWDEEWEAGGIDNDTGLPDGTTATWRAKNYIPVVPNATYYISKGTSYHIRYYWYDKDKTFIRSDFWTSSREFDVPYNAYYLKIRSTGSNNTYADNISINYPATDTDYHPYSGNQYTLALGQTVYGGTLDVTNGVLTVDRAMVDLGTLTYVSGGPNVFAATVSGLKVSVSGLSPLICTIYKTMNVTNILYNDDKVIWQYYNSANIRIHDTAYSDTTAFKTAMSGVQLVYELATPIEYTLTATQISTLKGQNNLWTDSGDITVEYLASGGANADLMKLAVAFMGR